MTKTYYKYNPHRHTKIWLSNTPSNFMNLENQVRLSTMCQKNPDDIIHLVYDATLLVLESVEELKNYCAENRIIPIDAHQFKDKLESDYESQLYQFYQDELRHLNNGGNLAVASDILRWLSPIYKLGTYTDFDFPVETSNLPSILEVEAPLLLNIGSLKLGKKELILANNDYVAVVDEKAAKEQIERIQQSIINKLNNYDNNFIAHIETQFQGNLIYQHILNLIKNRSEALYIVKSKEIHKAPITSRQLRNYIQSKMSDIDIFIEFNRQNQESNALVIKRIRSNLELQLTLIKRLFFKSEYAEIKSMLAQDDNEFISIFMKKEHILYLKSIIICTTGPIELSNALFNGYLLNRNDFISKVCPLSFNTYNLRKSFQSQNSIPLHENLFGMMRFLGVAEGELNDSSWLESGRILQEQRTKKLEMQKQKFTSTLPQLLLEIKIDIEEQLTKLSKNRFPTFFKAHKIIYKKALEELLYCFNQDTHEFDLDQFNNISSRLSLKRRFNVTNLYLKTLEDLAVLCHKAVAFTLTKNRKIKWDKS